MPFDVKYAKYVYYKLTERADAKEHAQSKC